MSELKVHCGHLRSLFVHNQQITTFLYIDIAKTFTPMYVVNLQVGFFTSHVWLVCAI